jgi:hypothetical protein
VIGHQGDNILTLGAGPDPFWSLGDGSDVIDGQSGTDFLLVRGSAAKQASLALELRIWITGGTSTSRSGSSAAASSFRLGKS